jgi:hypothetical protein
MASIRLFFARSARCIVSGVTGASVSTTASEMSGINSFHATHAPVRPTPLAAVSAAWDRLPAAVKAGIVAMV